MMHTGNVEPPRKTPTTGAKREVNAEQAGAAPGNRKAGRSESKRPWAVRKVNSPSWVEKIEEF
jgi:hypothetical protein